MSREDYIKVIDRYGIDVDADCVCSHWPMWGRGTYGILYKTKDGVFVYETGISDEGCEEEVLDCREFTVDEAKDYVRDYLELSAGVDAEDDLDEIIRLWKEIFGEDIKEW